MTPDREKLRQLAERVEALSGPDREVDALVWASTVGGYVEGNSIWFDDKGWLKRAVSLGDGMVRERKRLGDLTSAPRYTASLDAAMTLVPEGIGDEALSVILKRSNIGNGIMHSAVLLDTLTGADWLGEAATLALASPPLPFAPPLCTAGFRERDDGPMGAVPRRVR